MSVHLVDANVWLALALSAHVHHAAAREWLAAIDSPASVQFCRQTQIAFLRLLTTQAVLAPYGNAPLTNAAAWRAYEALLADDRIALRTDEPAGLGTRWRTFSRGANASPKLWMDAYLAAFAVSDGYSLVTTDTAFSQFAGLDLLLLG